MINEAELQICKSRGHFNVFLASDKWMQCEKCGMWIRKATVIQECAEDPPKEEQDQMQRLRREQAAKKKGEWH